MDVAEMTDDEDFVELVNAVARHRAPQTYRNRPNHFEVWNDTEFIQRFRLSKNGVQFLVENIEQEISSTTNRNHAVSAEEMVFLTLRYYATGSFVQLTADFIGIHKSTASRIIAKVFRAIAGLHTLFIKMPSTNDEMILISEEFYNIGRFPCCIGALDCTHVRIASPGGDQAEIYRNRKNFFSLNVQAICDASGKIEDLVVRWPGSSHDSTIFNNSSIRTKCEDDTFEDFLLVGDSGYSIRNFLITPLRNPITRPEQLFNEAQIRTRNPIERCFGMWKRRFPVLAFGIRLKLYKVEAIVVATAVLHNMARLLNESLPPINQEEQAAIDFVNNVEIDNVQDIGGINNIKRQQLIEYFRTLV